MHNNDEVNENDEIVRRVVGKLRGSTSKESYNLMARFSSSYTALLKKVIPLLHRETGSRKFAYEKFHSFQIRAVFQFVSK